MADIERVPQIPPLNPAPQFRPPLRDSHSRSGRRARVSQAEDRVEIEGEEPDRDELPDEDPSPEDDAHVDFRA